MAISEVGLSSRLVVGIDDMRSAGDLTSFLFTPDASFKSSLFLCLVVGIDDKHGADGRRWLRLSTIWEVFFFM